jgi:multidrug efflux pump subunit AcrA (membrane-fusion protein)
VLKIGTIRSAAQRRPWVSAGLVAVLAVSGGGIAWWATSSDSPAAAAASYRLVAASIGTIKQSVSTTGTIEPADQENVNFAASGQVTSVRVAEGDTVKKGDVLATINSASLAATLAQAEASLATAEAKVDSDNTSGITGTQLEADQAAVTAAQGQVDSARAALDGATLRSPIDGVVATVAVAVGDQVAGSAGGSNNGNGSDNGTGSTAQFLVIGTKSWVVNATVDDTQVGLLKKGNQAEITTDGGTTVYGTVSSVGLISSSTSGTAAYPVVVKVTGSPSGLHAGATGTVSLIYQQLANVLTVPSLAVHAGSSGSYVEELSGGKRVQHPVTTGLSSGGQTQIKSGLKEGDQVVVDIPQLGGGNGTSNRSRSGTGGGGNFPGGGEFPGQVVIDNGGPNSQVGGK